MYPLIIIALMFILPIASILADLLLWGSTEDVVFLVGKWFVFWTVGIRLFTAGLRQALTPEFTARQIFAIQDRKPLVVVQELGFANIAMGALGICTLFTTEWVMPAALAGGLFYALAGIRHATRREKKTLENIAMLSDLFAALILFLFLAASLLW